MPFVLVDLIVVIDLLAVLVALAITLIEIVQLLRTDLRFVVPVTLPVNRYPFVVGMLVLLLVVLD